MGDLTELIEAHHYRESSIIGAPGASHVSSARGLCVPRLFAMPE